MLEWTKKPKACSRHQKDEWTACKISNRVEIRAYIKNFTYLVIKVVDHRMAHKTQFSSSKRRRSFDLVNKGEPFEITFGTNGAMNLSLKEYGDMLIVIQIAMDKLSKDYKDYTEQWNS